MSAVLARPAVLYASWGHALCHGAKLLLPLLLTVAAADFGVSLERMSLALVAFGVAMALASVPSGLAADRFGPLPLLVVYFAALGTAAVACAAAETFTGFLVAHAALGAAAGLYHPPGLALISFSTDRDTMGPAMGWHGVASSIGVAAAPLGIYALLAGHGWRSVFVAVAVLAGVGVLAGVWLGRGGHVLAGRPVLHSAPHDGRVHRGALLLLVVAMSANGFLLDGFTTLFPLTVAAFSTLAAPDRLVEFAILALGGTGQIVGGYLARSRADSRHFLRLVALQPLIFAAVAFSLGAPTAAFLLLAAFAFANFALQPMENRMLAGFTSSTRRSTGYAMKFLVALLVGAAAPRIVVGLAVSHGHMAGWLLLGGVALLGLGGVALFLRVARTTMAPSRAAG